MKLFQLVFYIDRIEWFGTLQGEGGDIIIPLNSTDAKAILTQNKFEVATEAKEGAGTQINYQLKQTRGRNIAA